MPPQTPYRSPFLRAHERHSSRIRHEPQYVRAGPASSSLIGKKTSGSMPKHAARSCHMSGGDGLAGSVRRSTSANLSALTGVSPLGCATARPVPRGTRFITETGARAEGGEGPHPPAFLRGPDGGVPVG